MGNQLERELPRNTNAAEQGPITSLDAFWLVLADSLTDYQEGWEEFTASPNYQIHRHQLVHYEVPQVKTLRELFKHFIVDDASKQIITLLRKCKEEELDVDVRRQFEEYTEMIAEQLGPEVRDAMLVAFKPFSNNSHSVTILRDYVKAVVNAYETMEKQNPLNDSPDMI